VAGKERKREREKDKVKREREREEERERREERQIEETEEKRKRNKGTTIKVKNNAEQLTAVDNSSYLQKPLFFPIQRNRPMTSIPTRLQCPCTTIVN
jgi:hypothetical protein